MAPRVQKRTFSGSRLAGRMVESAAPSQGGKARAQLSSGPPETLLIFSQQLDDRGLTA
ncbi:hypothetical protein SAMN06296065_10889 [Novosphingobium panipatense]|uniref:Uncharacterized protein n=1 Tax=Novosphingobium panipatense TaxID=428991 RepID=A0ABY1QPX7_9SPHN|nr:hypothetical protein SAMN06296065_10889 [Novosphingobium panipatense]